MSYYCDTCRVSCPSNYQWQQHLSGRKHAQASKFGGVRGGGLKRGVCFYWQKGKCWKGDACTYLHGDGGTDGAALNDAPFASATTTSIDPTTRTTLTASVKRNNETKSSSSRQPQVVIMLCKGGIQDEEEDEASDTDKENMSTKLAPVFCRPVKKKSSPAEAKAATSKIFREEYRDAFKRKRDVNLYIEDGLVVWQFAYNPIAIAAIKEHIKGRTYEPLQRRWTSPLESLPDAVALYEHMGRKADAELKRRAADVERMFGGASALDALKLSVSLSALKGDADPSREGASTTADGDAFAFGSVAVTFLYDAEVVAALKMLSPVQRTYDPATKAWTVDLLALPEMLEHVKDLGYTPSVHLKKMAESCNRVNKLVYGADGPKEPEGAGDQKNASSAARAEGGNEEKAKNMGSEESKSTKEVGDRAEKLKSELKNLIMLVGKSAKTDDGLDRSDCGEAKRRRLTSAQIAWSERTRGDYFSDDGDSDFDLGDMGYGSFFNDDTFHSFARDRFDRADDIGAATAHDCDCGRPWKRVGGRHVCKYFGTFRCDCGKRWTSAHCWRDEMQACRSCGKESLPFKKEPLQNRVGKRTGAHDTANCGMCKKLGHDCTM